MTETLQRIEHCARRHPFLAKALFERLEFQARKKGDVKVALNSLVRRFFIEERLGLAIHLIDQLHSGLQQAEAHNLPYQAGRLMLCIGRVCYTQGIYKESIRSWTRCIDLCKINRGININFGNEQCRIDTLPRLQIPQSDKGTKGTAMVSQILSRREF